MQNDVKFVLYFNIVNKKCRVSSVLLSNKNDGKKIFEIKFQK